MRITARALLALLFVAGVVAGCGSDGTGRAQSPSPSDTTSAGSGSPEAARVTLHRSGGLKGSTVTLVFDAGQPPPDGFTRADVHAVLRAAAGLVGVRPAPMPQNPCCDRYSYVVLVSFADGSQRTFRSLDGVDQPPEFERLLRLVA